MFWAAANPYATLSSGNTPIVQYPLLHGCIPPFRVHRNVTMGAEVGAFTHLPMPVDTMQAPRFEKETSLTGYVLA